MHLVYLHGFATTPDYVQCRDFADRLATRGVTLHAPDLNVPDFDHLTLTAMLAKTAEVVGALPDGPVGIIGASMGGAVALHFADVYREAEARHVTRLLLLAPALDLKASYQHMLGEDGLAQWRRSGALKVFHYAYGVNRQIHYGLYADVARYDSHATDVRLPTLIFHGTRDEAVDHRRSVAYAESRPHVDLRLVDSDHQMLDQTDGIFEAMTAFFEV